MRFDGTCNAQIALSMKCSLEIYLSCGKKVGVFGLGISGQGAAFLCETLKFPYELVDENKGNLRTPHFETYGFCVFSPGFSKRHPWWIQAEALGIPCFTEIDFAVSCSKNKVIAVTGTNGKTSTVELVTQLLNAAGREALAVGNNGNVFSKAVANGFLSDEGLFVCEVSSFQAEVLKLLRPICTLFTNIAPDHLYYHGNFENYLLAKKNLLNLTQGPIICSSTLRPHLSNLSNTYFAEPVESLNRWLEQFPHGCSWGQRENFALVRAFAEHFKIPLQLLDFSLKRFVQPPHRLHCCHKWDSTEFWNDSKGTNLHAVKAALESFKNKANVHWILGGKSKGENEELLVEMFNLYPNISCIYLMGETGEVLSKLNQKFIAKTVFCHDLNTVFKCVKSSVLLPNYLVLSPGFASFDQFESFEQRGEVFERMARQFH